MTCYCGHDPEDHYHEWEACNKCDCRLYEQEEEPQDTEEEWQRVWR